MRSKFLFVIFSILCISQVSWGQNFNALEAENERELLETARRANRKEPYLRQADDSVAKEANRYFSSIYYLILEMDGLPRRLMKKWGNLKWTQTQFFGVDFSLCPTNMESTCEDEAQLVAKNHAFGKFGYIFINKNKWKNLSPSDKYSLIWHEVLGIIEQEEGAYTYSSMVEFSTECTSKVSRNQFNSECYMVAKLFDLSFKK